MKRLYTVDHLHKTPIDEDPTIYVLERNTQTNSPVSQLFFSFCCENKAHPVVVVNLRRLLVRHLGGGRGVGALAALVARLAAAVAVGVSGGQLALLGLVPPRSGTHVSTRRAKLRNRVFATGQGAGSRVATRRFRAMGQLNQALGQLGQRVSTNLYVLPHPGLPQLKQRRRLSRRGLRARTMGSPSSPSSGARTMGSPAARGAKTVFAFVSLLDIEALYASFHVVTLQW
jgi:hypothetical protein